MLLYPCDAGIHDAIRQGLQAQATNPFLRRRRQQRWLGMEKFEILQDHPRVVERLTIIAYEHGDFAEGILLLSGMFWVAQVDVFDTAAEVLLE